LATLRTRLVREGDRLEWVARANPKAVDFANLFALRDNFGTEFA